MSDACLVGGKAASLGEMYQELIEKGVRVPNGFATATGVYLEFLSAEAPCGTWDEVADDGQFGTLCFQAARAKTLGEALHILFADAPADDHLDMHGRTALARAFVLATPIPDLIVADLARGYETLCQEYGGTVDTAVAPPPRRRTPSWHPSRASTSRS